jgi:hypothetical protein
LVGVVARILPLPFVDWASIQDEFALADSETPVVEVDVEGMARY